MRTSTQRGARKLLLLGLELPKPTPRAPLLVLVRNPHALLSSTFSHSLSVLPYPELSPPVFGRFLVSRSVGCSLAEADSLPVATADDVGTFFDPAKDSVSVSLSALSLAPESFFLSADPVSVSACFFLSASCAACAMRTSCANQLIEYHSPAHSTDSTTKWMLYVARPRMKRTSWRAAKLALVAINKVRVGPGVKTLDHSSSMKEAMVLRLVGVCVLASWRESWASRGWTVGGISSRSDVAGEDRKLVSVGEGEMVKEEEKRG